MSKRKMKDSGVEWLGEIPAEWDVDRIGSFYQHRNEKVSDKDYAPLSVTMKGVVPQLETAAKSDDGDNRKLVRKGDFAINSRSDRRGSCGISFYDGSVSLINTILTPRGQMDPCYYNWLFHTQAFADEYYKWGHGIVDDLWTTRWSEMKRISIPRPTLSAQRKIAEYLDARCAKIDEMVSDAKKTIEEYKAWKSSVIFEAVTGKCKIENGECKIGGWAMRESGVEWIGMIPEGWRIGRLRSLTIKIGSGKTPVGGANVYQNAGVMFLRSQNVYDEGLRLDNVSYISDSIDSEMASTRVLKDDVLLNITGGSIGRCCIYNLSERANVNQHVCIIRIKRSLCMPEFVRFYINACHDDIVGVNQVGGNRQGLNFEQIGNVKIPCPSMEQQRAVVRFLDKKCAAIDRVIAEKESLVADLEAYKKSLIFECVTGKMEVA